MFTVRVQKGGDKKIMVHETSDIEQCTFSNRSGKVVRYFVYLKEVLLYHSVLNTS